MTGHKNWDIMQKNKDSPRVELSFGITELFLRLIK